MLGLATWNSMKEWAASDPLVKKWAFSRWPTDDETRATYVSHLRYLCKALKVKPKAFLTLLDGQPSQLTKDVRQHLETLSKTKNRLAANERAALSNYLNYHNDRPQKFVLAVDIKRKKKWTRPAWGLEEFQKILSHIYYKYRPALVLAVMTGQGRKEICYINEHYKEVEPLKGVPEAVQILMPIRKQDEEGYTVVMPMQEWKMFLENAPIQTSKGVLMHRIDLSWHVRAACLRAKVRVTGTSFHVFRAIYRTVAASKPYPGVDPKYLEQNLGHGDAFNYDRSGARVENIKERALAMIPYWEYVRRGGPPLVSKEELVTLHDENKILREALIDQLEDQLKNVKYELTHATYLLPEQKNELKKQEATLKERLDKLGKVVDSSTKVKPIVVAKE